MAEVRVGGAYIDWRSRNAQFLTGLDKNKRALREQRRALQSLRGQVDRFNSIARQIPLILAGAAAGMAVLVRQQAMFGSGLVEVSQRLGFSVERVQLLQRAFEGEGVAISTANIGLQRFTRRLADAAQGNELLLRTFNQLGVELRDSEGRLRGSHEVLLDVAEGLRNTDDQAERVRRAFQLFDSEGVAFVNVLQRGRDSLLAQQEAFRGLGVVTGNQARTLKNLDQSFVDLANSLRVAAAVAASEAAPEFQRLNETITSIGPDVIRSIGRAAATLVENLAAVRDTAVLVGALLAGRFVVQTVAAVGALKGLTVGTIALRVGLASLAGPGGWILLAGSALSFLALRLSSAEKETTTFARSVNELLNQAQPADVVNALETSIKRYEDRILALRESLDRPVTRGSFSRRLISRESIAQFEQDLAALRKRLAAAQEEALSGPLTPPPSIALPTRSRRDVGAAVERDIARQARASRQRIDLLRAEGEERLKLEARFAVANRFADEQIRLSAALVTAQGAARENLLAEQAALDRNVKSIDRLIAAKREQLEIDQRAAGLAGLQRALAARQAPEQIAFANPDEIPGLLEGIREQQKEVGEIAEQWERVQEARRNALESRVDIAAVGINALADGLANAAAHARSLGDALRSIALTVTSSLLRTFLPGLIAGAFGGGINFTPRLSPISRILPGRQAGGPVAAGQEVIVGEDGPERFRPSVAGNVIPGVGGGVNVSVGPFNIESTDGPGVRAALVDVVPVLRDEVVQAVRQTLRVDARRPSPA